MKTPISVNSNCMDNFFIQVFNKIAGSEKRPIDKAIALFSIIIYVVTILNFNTQNDRLFDAIYKYLSGDSESVESIKYISQIIYIPIYFLLIEISAFTRRYASLIAIHIETLLKYIVQYYPTDKILEDYKENKNIVLKYEAEQYLDKNKDKVVEKAIDNHNAIVRSIFVRKRNLMMISMLLAGNFIINSNIYISAPIYWSVVFIIAIYSAILPYDDINYMYIRNNRIRK